MSERHTHVCRVCEYKWQSMCPKDERAIIAAAKVNGNGPLCALCHHLEMASRYAALSGMTLVEAARRYLRMFAKKFPAVCSSECAPRVHGKSKPVPG